MTDRKPLTQADLHNRLAPQMVEQMVRGPLQNGGDLVDVVVLLESVVVGVAQAVAKLGGGDGVIETVATNAKTRFTQLRLLDAPKGGVQ